MKQCVAFCLAGLVALQICGCASTIRSGNEGVRNETEASLQAKLVKGKTTKQEVLAMFGKPSFSSRTAIEKNGKVEKGTYLLFNYSETQTQHAGLWFTPRVSNQSNVKTINITLDENDIVYDFDLGEMSNSFNTAAE